MPVDHIRYDILAQAALRGVVRTVLADTAKKGLPGDHHFKISFNTVAPGVRLSERMRAQYPQEMTIVLQHQFWDLTVGDDSFEVGLSFGGVPERVAVPFDAVTAFFDPSVQFGFQFETIESEAAAADAAAAAKPGEPASPPVAIRPVAVPAKTDASPNPVPSPTASPAPEHPPTGTEGGGEVVRLDRFRKKT
jgi:uncharacterized protein